MNEFTECMVNYIGILNSRGHEFGDYLEFGVSRGTSIVGAFNALKRMNQNEARLVGFDSFEGMPRTAGSEGWAPGAYASSIGATRRYIEKNGGNFDRIELVEGWFSETLNDRMRDELGISKASIIMVDCDIFSATQDVLNFCTPLIDDVAILIFDDWGPMERAGKRGQKEAFQEFMDVNPDLSSEAIPSYKTYGAENARAFIIERKH